MEVKVVYKKTATYSIKLTMSGGKLLVRGARQAVLVCRAGERALRGEEMKTLASLEQDGDNGKYGSTKFDRVIDAAGMSILPGLIDGHTHPVWAGDRVHEFAMKLAGATYMEVHKAGGGINFTVEHTRRASEDELYTLFRDRLLRMVRAGTTLVECKSGYGLEVETEMKMLRVIQRAKRELPIEISSTFCGAHSVPRGSTMEQATDDVINVQLPRLRELMKSGDLEVDNIDVFCEKGVFDVDSTRRILQAGVEAGLAINFHGDELHPMNSAELGAELKARAISHLEEISDAGIKAMADSGSVAVILPTTAYILRLTPPPARKMIDSGVVVALGSDFNPNAFCLSMPMTMHLACVNFRMSMNESLAAATINAAASLGRAETHGSLEVGKFGDLVIINAPRWEHLIYQLAGHDHLIKYVVKKGEVIHSAA
ncbi:putative imidazolonepropionase [Branchiostoma belcheri]|nr:putative imidazolonepropionase [Branchiostoma belcheri]